MTRAVLADNLPAILRGVRMVLGALLAGALIGAFTGAFGVGEQGVPIGAVAGGVVGAFAAVMLLVQKLARRRMHPALAWLAVAGGWALVSMLWALIGSPVCQVIGIVSSQCALESVEWGLTGLVTILLVFLLVIGARSLRAAWRWGWAVVRRLFEIAGEKTGRRTP